MGLINFVEEMWSRQHYIYFEKLIIFENPITFVRMQLFLQTKKILLILEILFFENKAACASANMCKYTIIIIIIIIIITLFSVDFHITITI